MNAVELAARISRGSTVPWSRLEHAAFSGYPEAVTTLGAGRKRTKLELLWFVPLVVVVLCVALAPLAGAVILSNGGRWATAARASDPATTIPASGILFGAAAVAMIVLVVHWIVSKESTLVRGFGLYTALCAAGALVAIDRLGEEHEVASYQLWRIPVAVAAVLGGILGVLLIVDRLTRGRRRTSAPAGLSAAQSELLDARRERVAQLPEAVRDAVRRDLDAAVQDLERRGLITVADAELARSAELGGLALRMASRTTPVHS